ncbi:MFS transporter [Martelella mediterranea]|uniref:MFS transporter n=1 Tax=Martelella mediterranea TaxID=293089 RepID=UPI001F19604B|nr:MFS transporter [Martelella mediterranea]
MFPPTPVCINASVNYSGDHHGPCSNRPALREQLPTEDIAVTNPLAVPIFRALWFATLVSNIGTWMSSVGAGWLMTSLAPDPLVVALVQVASTFPMFILALPAGALADIVDRRKLLICAQLFAIAAAGSLAFSTWAGLMTAPLLLAFTGLMAIGAALAAPAFQAIVPELVAREALQDAVTLNGLAINIARAIGPALAGLIIAATGPEAVFALNALSTMGVVLVLWRWKRKTEVSLLPPEHLSGAMRVGLRYALRSAELQSVLVRAAVFIVFASCLWALLPLIARDTLGQGAAGYGGLLGFMGIGAVVGAVLMPRLRALVSTNRISIVASILMAAALASLAAVKDFGVASTLLFGIGICWIAMMSALNGAAQASSADWVKARALAVYLLAFQGSMSLGALFWGALAGAWGIPLTLSIAAAGMAVLTLLVARRFALNTAATQDFAPSDHWPTPIVAAEPEADRGPVLITIEYHLDSNDVAAFSQTMAGMRRIRKRDGAIRWGLFEDVARPGVLIETFTVESWLEHLRQHARVSNADRVLQDAVTAFHTGDERPIIRHFIAPKR